MIAKTTKKEVSIKNVGPIQDLKIPVPEHGGVVVLKGTNGSGKTHAIQSVESLTNKEVRRQLRPSDGSDKGMIKGLGVTVRLGRSNTAKGELVCESLDGRLDPSLFVNPGIKDAEKADLKRLETLVRLAGITIDIVKWNELLKGCDQSQVEMVSMEDLIDSDPVVTANNVRRRFHAVALQLERSAENKTTEASTLRSSIQAVEVPEGFSLAVARAELQKANMELARAEEHNKAVGEAMLRRKQAETKLQEIGEVNIEPIRKQQGEFEKALNNEVETIGELEEQIAEMKRKLEVSKSSKALLESKIEGCKAQIASAEQSQRLVSELKQAVSSVKEPIDTEAIQADIDDLTDSLFQAERYEEAIAAEARAARADKEAESIAHEAERFRRLARSTDSVLQNELLAAGFDQVIIRDGRLCVKSDRGTEKVSDLSFGERWALALDLAAKGLHAGAILPVEQEAWEGLDPANRMAVHRAAVERGLTIFTAEATSGSLRAEVFES